MAMMEKRVRRGENGEEGKSRRRLREME